MTAEHSEHAFGWPLAGEHQLRTARSKSSAVTIQLTSTMRHPNKPKRVQGFHPIRGAARGRYGITSPLARIPAKAHFPLNSTGPQLNRLGPVWGMKSSF